ncbi:MAG: hypothetical protein IJD35_03120 [Clostridia bacterium]|nr:hypothetical protein [Clostridia bacterium]
MKRILLSVLAVTLLVTMLFTLTSCGPKPDGKYGHKNLNLEFDGDKVTVNVDFLVKVSASGTYEMDDDKIVITYEGNDSTSSMPTNLVYDADNDTIKCKLGVLGEITLEKVK